MSIRTIIILVINFLVSTVGSWATNKLVDLGYLSANMGFIISLVAITVTFLLWLFSLYCEAAEG